jgi:hypothetical protein
MKLNAASDRSQSRIDGVVDLAIWGSDETAPGGFIHGKPASALSGHPDISRFLLLDDPADELFLPAGLGTDHIQALLADLRRGQTKVLPKSPFA